MHGTKASHGETNDVGLFDVQAIEHSDRIVRRNRLRIGLDTLRYVRRRIAARGVGDAAMAAAEKAQLRLPARMVAAELMDEEDRRALAGFFRMELHAVLGGDHGHRSASSE